MTSEIMKRAWHIRRISAKRFGVKIMEILWGECLRMAKTAISKENKNRQPLVIEQTWAGNRPGLVAKVVRRLKGWRF